MFKTKAAFKLPDPPKPPTQNMMEEDLKIASTDDDLFKLLLSTEDSGMWIKYFSLKKLTTDWLFFKYSHKPWIYL